MDASSIEGISGTALLRVAGPDGAVGTAVLRHGELPDGPTEDRATIWLAAPDDGEP